MNNYHNGDVTLDEVWDLALYVEKKISSIDISRGTYSQQVNTILSSLGYIIYDRNPLEVYLEQNETRFIADNERIEPSGSGI